MARVRCTIISMAITLAAIEAPATAAPWANIGSTVGQTPKINVFYDYKGSRLGMTVAEWKTLPQPGTDLPGFGPTQAICQDDKLEPSKGLSDSRSEAEARASVVKCGYYSRDLSQTIESLAWATVGFRIGQADVGNVSYRFLDDKLYEIDFMASSSVLPDILTGLRAKWGAPTSELHDTTQTRAGSTFPHSVTTWENPAAIIRVEAPYRTMDYLKVTYETFEGAKRITAIEKALHPDAGQM